MVCSLCLVLCNLQITSCKIALLLPVVYFVLEIASKCWCPSIICLTSTNSLDIEFVIIVSKSGLLAIETILSLLKIGIALGPAAILFTALSTLKSFLALSLSLICYTSQASPFQNPFPDSLRIVIPVLDSHSKPPILDNDNAVIYACPTQLLSLDIRDLLPLLWQKQSSQLSVPNVLMLVGKTYYGQRCGCRIGQCGGCFIAKGGHPLLECFWVLAQILIKLRKGLHKQDVLI